jgi:predicted lipid-binding transport protein (Tim44 family)
MGVGGSFPIDLILFGMIAVFLVLRLRSILGKREGFERPPEIRPETRAGDTLQGAGPRRVIDVVPDSVIASRQLPDPAGPVGQLLSRMQLIDRNLQAARFLEGAETAFRMIVTAFAAGASDTLRPLLSDETYRAFDAAISAREAAGQTQRTEIRDIKAATIEHAELRGTRATITVRFVSDQVNVTLGQDNTPVAGADTMTEMTDLWTFERDLESGDPTWRLVSARSA